MAETILALVGSILAIVLWALKKHDENAPQRAEDHRDEHLATPDLDAVSVDLDRLFTESGGPVKIEEPIDKSIQQKTKS